MTTLKNSELTRLESCILGFFAAKGLLIAPHVSPNGSVKLKVSDVVRFGLESEPRVIEVLPAAILHFPRSFLGRDAMPEKLAAVIKCIREGKQKGPSLAGIPYQAMLRWANEPLPDKRTKPEKERRITKAFRLKRGAWERLRKGANESGKTETRYLEDLLLQDR